MKRGASVLMRKDAVPAIARARTISLKMGEELEARATMDEYWVAHAPSSDEIRALLCLWLLVKPALIAGESARRQAKGYLSARQGRFWSYVG